MDRQEDFYPAVRKISIISFILSLLAAIILTYVDWQKNPAGLFHSAEGTDWSIVWETFASWFVPLFFGLIAVLGFAAYIVYLIKKKNRDTDIN